MAVGSLCLDAWRGLYLARQKDLPVLYHLLYSLHETFSWLNVFKYQTFRAMLAFLVAFVFVLVLQPVFIRSS